MNVLWILLPCAAVLLLAARFYGRFIARTLGEDRARQTPALLRNDGRDFVPTKTPVVFAHHFASIAGAGPIIGPVLAMLYGWGPAVLWIVLGGIFIGAVHDYAATHIAVREGGRSLAVVARRTLGPTSFLLVSFLLVAMLALVCAAFLDLSATALTSMVPLSKLGLEPGKHVFRQTTIAPDGTALAEPHAIIGGIASMSVIIITATSPLIGLLYLKKRLPLWICSALALGICAVSICIGLKLPVAVSAGTWKLLIAAYVLVAAGLPVWLFLQSRDFINVHILYCGIGFLVASVVAAGLRGEPGSVNLMPAHNVAEAAATPGLGPLWPVLFITIACGAVSGFHSLCAGGTTCKQLTSEASARRVGYFAMLLESFLAVSVVCCCAVGLSLVAYKGYVYPAHGKGNAVLAFGMAVGHTANKGLGLPVAFGALGAMLMFEGFAVTTLDTAVRLTRYLLEEAWAALLNHRREAQQPAPDAVALAGAGGLQISLRHPSPPTAPHARPSGPARLLVPLLQHYWLNSAIAVALMLILAMTNGYKAIWALFASANQLWAGLGLLIASLWLLQRNRKPWVTAIPAALMLLTTLVMLLRLLVLDYLPNWRGKAPLLATDLAVLLVTGALLAAAARSFLLRRALPGHPDAATSPMTTD